MHTRDRTDSREIDVFSDPGLMDDLEKDEGAVETHKSLHTSSQLVAWYLCHFQGYHLSRKTCAPKSGFLGSVSYKTTWWLHY